MPFRDLAGHRRLLAMLSSAAVRGSLPPSLIFAGPVGVGKRAAAVALAQLLNCLNQPQTGTVEGRGPGQSPVEEDACGQCTACSKIARGVHPDLTVLEPGDTGVIKIEQAREVVDMATYRPFEGRRRVVVIDPADALNAEAQNALLKTLEEPPPASTFVLVTARPDVLLPTVRSRCQRVRFGRLTEAEVASVLVRERNYGPAAAHAAAAAADGSVGQALEGASEDFAAARDAAIQVLAGAAESTDPAARLALAKVLMAADGRTEREGLSRRLRALSSLVRDLGVLASDADGRWLANSDVRSGLEAMRSSWDRDRALRAFSSVDRALGALERNASAKVVADWLAVEL